MKDSILRVECPCCGAALEIDAASGVVLSHRDRRPRKPSKDLAKAVAEVRQGEARRDEAFRRALEAEKGREAAMDRKFDALVERGKGQPARPALRDIDLD